MPLCWQYTWYTKIWPLPACAICFLFHFDFGLLIFYCLIEFLSLKPSVSSLFGFKIVIYWLPLSINWCLKYWALQGSILWDSASNEFLLSRGGTESQFGGRHYRNVCRTDVAGSQNYGGSSLVSHYSVFHLLGGSKLPTFVLYVDFWNIYAVIWDHSFGVHMSDI